MSLFSEIEKTIERGFHRFAERMFGPADSNELLLLHRAILAEVESKVQIVARGRRVFPFARVVVTLVAAEAERRAILQAAFGERLGADIREAMEGSECDLPRGFSVEVHTSEAGLRAFDIAYSVEPVKAGASLAAALGASISGKRVLIPRGTIALETVPEALRARGAIVETVTVYTTSPPEDAGAGSLAHRVLAGEFDVVTFASPSAAANFAAVFRPEELAVVADHARIAAIGPTTAEAVRALGLPVHIVAREPTAAGFVGCIEEYYS